MSRKFSLQQLKDLSITVSAVLIPVAIVLIGNWYSHAIKERELQGKFVELAVDILREDPVDANKNLREWAIQVVDRYSGVPLSKSVKDDLVKKIPIPEKRITPVYKTPTISGLGGLISNKVLRNPNAMTSYGVPYRLNYNICEVNAASPRFKEGLPSLGDFLRVKNNFNNFETKCMVVGTFNDSRNIGRLILMPEGVFRQLDIHSMETSITLNRVSGSEICSEKNLLDLMELYELKPPCRE